MAEALASENIFPSIVVEMAGVGEETGKLDDLLFKSADYFESEVSRIAERPRFNAGTGIDLDYGRYYRVDCSFCSAAYVRNISDDMTQGKEGRLCKYFGIIRVLLWWSC